MQHWRLYPTDVHQNSALPPLPPGAVLLSDEIIERDNLPSRIFPVASTSYQPKDFSLSMTRRNGPSRRRQSLQHFIQTDAGWWTRPQRGILPSSTNKWQARDDNLPKNEISHYSRGSTHRLRANNLERTSSVETLINRTYRPREKIKHSIYEDESARSSSSLPDIIQGREAYYTIHRKNGHSREMGSPRRYRYLSPPDNRKRTVSESALSRRYKDYLPEQLRDHALRDKTRPMSRRRAIRLNDNLLCLPAVERIVEKRFYVRKDTEPKGRNPKSGTPADTTGKDVAEATSKDMSKLLDEMRGIKSDIEMLQRKHAELLDETRLLKPRLRPPTVTKDNAFVQTDMDTDSSRQNLANTNYASVVAKNQSRYSSSSTVSSDETIKNIHSHRLSPAGPPNVPSLQRKDVPASYEGSKRTGTFSTSDEVERYESDKSNDNGSSSTLDRGGKGYAATRVQNPVPYENISYLRNRVGSVEQNISTSAKSKDLRVFKVAPPEFSSNGEMQKPYDLNSEDFVVEEQTSFDPVHTKLAVDPLTGSYNTWPGQQHTLEVVPNMTSHYGTSRVYVPGVHPSRTEQVTGAKVRNYADVIKEAYGIESTPHHSAIKPRPTATVSYASAEDDTLLENLNLAEAPNNVFSLVEPSLSYQDNSFHVDTSGMLPNAVPQKQYAQPQQNRYGGPNVATTVPRANARRSTFEDLVHQYNTVNNVVQPNSYGYMNGTGAGRKPSNNYLSSGDSQSYGNFIC